MLVLSRKANEGVSIGHDIFIVVLHVRGGTCKLGIKAPEEMEINRLEPHKAGRFPWDGKGYQFPQS